MSDSARSWGLAFSTLAVAVVATLVPTRPAQAINPPVPNASRSYNLTGTVPLTAHFDASLSTCDGGCTYYSWYFAEDNSSVQAVTTTYTYKTAGTHIAKLYVSDSRGPLSAVEMDVTVTVTASSLGPIADATKSPNLKGAVPLTAKFDGSLSNCANTCGSYTWAFGDGTSATVPDPVTTHTYTKVGTYNVTMTATDAGNGKKSSTTVQVVVVPAESLTSYVQACQTQLNFQNVPIPDKIDCYDGELFQTSDDFDQNPSVNDYMGYKKITDQVDMAFACRWLFGNKETDRRAPISIEMLLHNRQNGNTCFFSAKGFVSGDPNLTSSVIVSPTSSAAASFWDAPASVDSHVRCIGCHVSGPYIATPTIAPFLAKFGLLNNGHDTLSNVSSSDLSTPNKNVKYHAISALVNGVAGAFSQWDSLKQSYLDPGESCSIGCHMIGTRSPQDDITQQQRGATTILHSPVNQLKEIDYAGVMRPYDDGSDYRWINLDNAADGTETETFSVAKGATSTLVPKLFAFTTDPSEPNATCGAGKVPNVLEAHVVGSDNEFILTQPSKFTFLADRLVAFNLKDGLVCLNSDQESGTQCQDYRVRYECTDSTGKKTWTDWYNTDSPSGDGDHEEKSRAANLCTSPAGSKATAIQAAFTAINGWTYSSIGPNDRLAQFSQFGVTCNTADQPDGQCSNYVVRYSSCADPAPNVTKFLTNVFTGKQLTSASGSLVKGQSHNDQWNTQRWSIETVANTEYVRVRLPNSNVYLNVTSQAESAVVGTAGLSAATSEMWLVEPVSGSADVRLKNLWTGKYLTMADPKNVPSTPDFLPIYSQGRNTGWTSQRWMLQ